MRRCGKLWRLVGLSQRKHRLIRIRPRSKRQILTTEHWMPYLVRWPMRSSKRDPQLKLLRKHWPFSRKLMKGLRVSRTQNSKGLLSRPKRDTWICDHDRHANIKPKPDINNQLNFYKTFTKASLFPLILVSLLK